MVYLKEGEGATGAKVRQKNRIALDKAGGLQYYKNMTAKHSDTSKNKYRKPKRVFEKSGLVVPEMSYYVPLENVVNADKHDIQTMIDRGRYFSIFAPR